MRRARWRLILYQRARSKVTVAIAILQHTIRKVQLKTERTKLFMFLFHVPLPRHQRSNIHIRIFLFFCRQRSEGVHNFFCSLRPDCSRITFRGSYSSEYFGYSQIFQISTTSKTQINLLTWYSIPTGRCRMVLCDTTHNFSMQLKLSAERMITTAADFRQYKRVLR